MTSEHNKPADVDRLGGTACYMADLDRLLNMLQPNFDWEAYWENGTDGADDLFRKLYRWHDYRDGPREVGTVDCGGHCFDDSPKTLYRALYLLRPSHVDFADMYKTGSLIDFVSPCNEFMISLQLFKYEFQAYFSCAENHARGQLHGVIGGWADADNGVSCGSELGNKWFDIAVRAIERRWDVYRGNNFMV